MRTKAQYTGIMYLRLSSEDKEKAVESNSIKNQRQLILEFLKKHPEIRLIGEKVDDGYSGVNFDRPGFQEMMEEIRSGRCNCVIVKDLSRFARNFIESGKYLQQLFPFLGVRFIAINDNYDSADSDFQTDNLYIPLKNLINDTYSRDISIKMRSYCDYRMSKGLLVCSFPVYGYLKDSERKHLIVDEYAAGIVQSIFRCKLGGMSNQGIANKLNEQQVLCPADYKRSIGMKFKSGFRQNKVSKWSHGTVLRILSNPVYTGCLVQGKRYRPNYKVKKAVNRAEDSWSVTENTHEAIVGNAEFETVQRLLLVDYNIPNGRDTVYMLSGLLFCADCHQVMTRRYVTYKDKRYVYYNCSSHRHDKTACSMHSIKESSITDSLIEIINQHIAAVIEIDKMLRYIERLPEQEREAQLIDRKIEKLKEELERNSNYKRLTFEKFTDGIIDEKMFTEYISIYEQKCEDIRQAIEKHQEELNKVVSEKSADNSWVEFFKKYRKIHALDRALLVMLVDHIDVFEGNRFKVFFKYQSQYEIAKNYIAEKLSKEE